VSRTAGSCPGQIWRAGALALLALAILPACRSAPPPSISGVKVGPALADAVGEVGLDPAAVEELTRAALAESGFRLEPARERSFEARVEVVALRVVPAQGGAGMTAELAVEVELVPARGDEPPHKETGRASAPVGAGGPMKAVRVALTSAISEAVRGLRVGVASDVKGDDSLIADLSAADARVRGQAVQALGDRGVRAAVPALIGRLRDSDPKVAHRAVGALAQIKDPRAVPPLIDLCRSGDSALALRMVRIVGDIGGRDAQGWLLVTEQAHPDPRVREAASEALDELRRAATPAKTPPAAR
jgi:hypothetical protein